MSVGSSTVRLDAAAKAGGAAQFPADRVGLDALWAKVVFTNQPHARLISLDTSAARSAAGVHAVITADDVAVNEYGLTMRDQPVLVGPSQCPRSAVASDVSRWEADHLAVVVAETPEQAGAAAELIRADWAQLPVLGDIDTALAAEAPLIHPENGHGSNAYHALRIRKGDMAEGWASAAATVVSEYELPYQEHAYLQPEAALSYIDAQGRVTVEIAGQWAHEDREQIACCLDLPAEAVRVIYPAIGGAFGGREDMSLQIVLALAAKKLHERGVSRPVAAVWSREESIVGHHKRHRGRISCRWGADEHGLLVAVESTATLDAGAYNYTSNKVLGNCHLGQAGPYFVPNACIDSRAVYTNNVPGGAFRGFGAPQAAFVAESQMNKLAAAIGLDPVEMRRRNLLDEHKVTVTQTRLPSPVTLRQVVDACAERAGGPAGPVPFSSFRSLPAPPVSPVPAAPAVPASTADEPSADEPPTRSAASPLRAGRGFACAFKNVGFSFGFPERCEARVVLHGSADDSRPESAELFHAGAEVGQGAHTAFAQMAAGALDLPVEQIRCRFSDTATSGDSGSASASRLTWMAGNAILGAAEEAEKAWIDGCRPAEGSFRFVPPPTEALDPQTGAGRPNFAYGYVAQAVDITVDIETGHIVVDRVVSAHDVGRAVNPELVAGQIHGAIAQGHGYVMSEDLRVSEGRVVNPRLSTYLIPGIGDVPAAVEPVVLELADPLGPFGARGMAEMPLITYAPAVVAALHDAIGVWADSFPLTPSRVLAALADAVSAEAVSR